MSSPSHHRPGQAWFEASTHLVLPLRGHDLRIHAADVDAGVHAGLEVALHNLAANGGTSAGCI